MAETHWSSKLSVNITGALLLKDFIAGLNNKRGQYVKLLSNRIYAGYLKSQEKRCEEGPAQVIIVSGAFPVT